MGFYLANINLLEVKLLVFLIFWYRPHGNKRFEEGTTILGVLKAWLLINECYWNEDL